MDRYEDKLQRERQWYTQPAFQAKHFLNSRLFYSPERNAFNYVFPKRQLAQFVAETCSAGGLSKPSVLIAPIGAGNDVQYFSDLAGSISGVDISEEAIGRIRDGRVEKFVGDMRNMAMFAQSQFDVVAIPLFFHHFVSFGFDGFLREAHRVLRPGGHLFSLEPNILHPVSWITWGARKVVGNITGNVDDERPLNPLELARAMKRCGFRNVQVRGASFSHNRVPIWMARTINVVTLPLNRFPVVKYLAWMCVFYGQK